MPAAPTEIDLATAKVVTEIHRSRQESATAMAARIGMTKSRLWELMNGRLRWYLGDLATVADALDVDPVLVLSAAGYGDMRWPPIRDAILHAPDLSSAQRAELLGVLGRVRPGG